MQMNPYERSFNYRMPAKLRSVLDLTLSIYSCINSETKEKTITAFTATLPPAVI